MNPRHPQVKDSNKSLVDDDEDEERSREPVLPKITSLLPPSSITPTIYTPVPVRHVPLSKQQHHYSNAAFHIIPTTNTSDATITTQSTFRPIPQQPMYIQPQKLASPVFATQVFSPPPQHQQQLDDESTKKIKWHYYAQDESAQQQAKQNTMYNDQQQKQLQRQQQQQQQHITRSKAAKLHHSPSPPHEQDSPIPFHHSASAAPYPLGRKRVSKACKECQIRHVRCGFERPCERCERLGITCTDGSGSRKRGKRNDENTNEHVAPASIPSIANPLSNVAVPQILQPVSFEHQQHTPVQAAPPVRILRAPHLSSLLQPQQQQTPLMMPLRPQASLGTVSLLSYLKTADNEEQQDKK